MKFKYLCDLFEELEALELSDARLRADAKAAQYNDSIRYWFHRHRSLITDYGALLSCLLPEKRVDRVYGMQRARFIPAVCDCLSLGRDRSERLRQANPTDDLALILEKVVDEHGGGLGSVTVTVSEIDTCLADLAAISRWSDPKLRNNMSSHNSRNQRQILRPLLQRLQARDMKWFVRMFFKNLDPLQLHIDLVLKVAHPLLPLALRARESFDAALALLNDAELRTYMDDHGFRFSDMPNELLKNVLRPCVGSKIGRPRFPKARSFKNCADMVGSRRWSVEPKLDGEYCQVHVDLSKGEDCLQFFSKSGKDSTQDRKGVHQWVKQVLKIGDQPRFRDKCIIEGELVVVDNRDNTILEFAKIRKFVSRSGSFLGTKQDSAPHEHEQLRIFFYDALLIDDDVLIHEPYITRRERLRQLLPSEHGFACRGAWTLLEFDKPMRDPPRGIERALKNVFSKSCAKRYEGVVLKPANGAYLNLLPSQTSNYDGVQIKLKSDYIPGLGDTADFAIIGAFSLAVHDVEPAPLKQTRWTHFVIACLMNKKQLQNGKARPVYKNLATISRPCVSHDDMLYLSHHGHLRQLHQADVGEECTPYDLQPDDAHSRPQALFKQPFIVELLGSSFERPPNSKHYMLRHPRIVKIHNDDRGVSDIISFEELQQLAKEAREIPPDILAEEKRVMEQIYTVCKLRPCSLDKEPSQTTSPASTRSTRSPNVLVRMDSCEMTANDERFVSPLATRTGLGNARSFIETPSALKPTEIPTAQRNENAHSRKRKLANAQEISPPKKRSIQRSKSDGYEQTRQPPGDLPPTHICSVTSVGEIFETPPSRLHSARHISRRTSSSIQSSRRPGDLDSSQTITKQLIAKLHSELRRIMPSNLKTVVWSARALPAALNRPSPLEESVILLSPEIATFKTLTEHLIPLVKASQTMQLHYWQRDRRPFADKTGHVVEESQSDPGLAKLLLIDTSSGASNDDFISQVMQTRLDVDETIDVWDWRSLEEIARHDTLVTKKSSTRQELSDSAEKVENHFIGMIKMTSRTATDAIIRLGFEQAQRQEPNLTQALFAMPTEQFEEGQDLMNVFLVPSDGGARDAWRLWLTASAQDLEKKR